MNNPTIYVFRKVINSVEEFDVLSYIYTLEYLYTVFEEGDKLIISVVGRQNAFCKFDIKE